ncbi:hypothetical protein Tco_1539498 [Tanacetum coccineum]
MLQTRRPRGQPPSTATTPHPHVTVLTPALLIRRCCAWQIRDASRSSGGRWPITAWFRKPAGEGSAYSTTNLYTDFLKCPAYYISWALKECWPDPMGRLRWNLFSLSATVLIRLIYTMPMDGFEKDDNSIPEDLPGIPPIPPSGISDRSDTWLLPQKHGHLIGMSPIEMKEVVGTKIEGIFRQRLDKPSSSPWGASGLVCQEKDGSFRMCIGLRD